MQWAARRWCHSHSVPGLVAAFRRPASTCKEPCLRSPEIKAIRHIDFAPHQRHRWDAEPRLDLSDKARDAVAPALSVTRAVNVNMPAVVGTPLRRPDGNKVRPGGRVPASSAQRSGGTPPVAWRFSTYDRETAPGASAAVAIEIEVLAITIVSAFVSLPVESVARTVKLNDPEAVGCRKVRQPLTTTGRQAGRRMRSTRFAFHPRRSRPAWLADTPRQLSRSGRCSS